MRHQLFITTLLLALASLSAASQTINEDQQLASNDPASAELFGRSIAISNGIIAVGAIYGDGITDRTGTAYLFDESTGTQLFKLAADDGGFGVQFGAEIAIDNGIVAVGAEEESLIAPEAGAVYLFDTYTGIQTAKLTADDAMESAKFGSSIVISDGVIAIGAPGDMNNNGNESGSVYLFNAATGTQFLKIQPKDGAPGDYFGHCVALADGVLAVGALWDDDNGEDSGSVYLFDISTGNQITKIYPDDAAEYDRFGQSIDIDNNILAVGASQYHFRTKLNGAAYLFDINTHNQLLKLTASDGEIHDFFGGSIDINNNLVVVGATGDDESETNSGSAYIFDATTGDQYVKLLASDPGEYDTFGISVAINQNKVVVGAYQHNIQPAGSGTAYLFNFTAPLRETLKVTSSDGAINDLFGHAIAIHNNTIATTARSNDDNGSNSGSAYIIDATNGTQLHKLLPNDGAQGDQFGVSIDIHNTTAVVGAWRDDDNGNQSGSAYTFDTITGTQLRKLLPIDGETSDSFGLSVAIDNNMIAVGSILDDDNGSASGSAYLFDATTGTQLHKLLPNDGSPNAQFGYSVDIHNNIVAVGAVNEGDNELGAAYLFDATTGAQLHKLTPTIRWEDDQFGGSIAIHNNTVAVGAPQHDAQGPESGAAYLFDATTGQQLYQLLPNANSDFDAFGYSIAIDNNTLAVGEWRDDYRAFNAGTAHLFDATTGERLATLLPTDGEEEDRFANAIAIHNNTIAVSAWHDDDQGTDSGSIYIFNTQPQTCPADLTNDGELDFFDISAFLAAFSSADPAADFNNDTQLDFFDLSAFLTAFAAGCP